MDLQLNGMRAYVTGTATGIGREIVRSLAAEGVDVFAVDIAIDALDEYVEADGLTTVRTHGADLSTLDGCTAAAQAGVEHFGGPPDILVNNAGIGRMLPFEELSDDDFLRTFALNFFAAVRTCRVLLPQMRAAGSGSVVNVASDLAGQPESVFVDYSASKAALVNFAKSLARGYAPHIRVNNVCPGPVWTPLWYRPGGFVETLEKNYGVPGDEAVAAMIKDREIPMARLGTPEEVASAVVFLASPISSFTTGASLGVDGGTVRAAL
jgi:NAD(P)-dependent dehydrogenase (short-subunit alcohol dehydrogenase family)